MWREKKNPAPNPRRAEGAEAAGKKRHDSTRVSVSLVWRGPATPLSSPRPPSPRQSAVVSSPPREAARFFTAARLPLPVPVDVSEPPRPPPSSKASLPVLPSLPRRQRNTPPCFIITQRPLPHEATETGRDQQPATSPSEPCCSPLRVRVRLCAAGRRGKRRRGAMEAEKKAPAVSDVGAWASIINQLEKGS